MRLCFSPSTLTVAPGVAAVLAVTALAAVLSPSAEAATPAVAWCGTAAATNRPDTVPTQFVHVVYAAPNERPSRLAALAGPIVTDLAAVDSWWRGQDPSRTIRFDLFPFAGCGPGFGQLDITSIALPRGSTSYSGNPFTSIVSDLRSLGFTDATKKYLVYYDGPTANADVCGQGGGLYALVYLAGCTDDVGAAGEKALTAAHELTHTFGAVSDAAPNECEAPHGHHVCDSTSDLMYWAASVSTLADAVLDVGRDDYYGHSGSWLDIQDSVWLLQVGTPQVELEAAVEGGGYVTSEPAGITDCRATCSFFYNRGAAVTLRASADSGMQFRRWEGDCSGAAPCTVQLDAARSVRAVFAPPNQRPTASFEVETIYEVGQPIVFSSASNDPDGSIRKTEWDFGDGTRSSRVKVKHAYRRRGVFRIRLTVTDDEGAATSVDRVVVIMNMPPSAVARPRTARQGARVRLAYRVTDNVRVDRARIEVFAGRDSGTFNRKIRARSRSGFVTWRTPKRSGTFIWCVRAWDSRGQASPRACAAVRVR